MSTNAEPTPKAASVPNERRAGMSEVRLAPKATMVVREVSMIARPTRVSATLAAESGERPARRSSL